MEDGGLRHRGGHVTWQVTVTDALEPLWSLGLNTRSENSDKLLQWVFV